MTSPDSLEAERRDFISRSRRYLAFPIAGAVVWAGVGVASLFVGERTALWILLFGSGAIFPLALAVARITGQDVFVPANRFGRLAGLCVLMVNLLWAVHLPLVAVAPQMVPLSVAIGLGLHWIVFGWINGSSFGVVHAVTRTALCVGAFHVFPGQRMFAVALAVVAAYALTILQLRTDRSFELETTAGEAVS